MKCKKRYQLLEFSYVLGGTFRLFEKAIASKSGQFMPLIFN